MSKERSNIILKNLSIEKNIVRCTVDVSEDIKQYFTSDSFFIDYGEDVSKIPESILMCPFVGTLLSFAWITNSVIWVNELDRTYYNSLFRVREAFQEIYSHFQLKGRVVPSKFVDNEMNLDESVNKSVLLFSGGADCHTSYICNIEKKPVLCNIQGWFTSEEQENEAANADFRDIDKFSKQNSVPFCYVKTNFATILDLFKVDKKYGKLIKDNMWHGFIHPMAFISIAIPLAFKRGIKEIIIASSLFPGINIQCASYPTTDSEFRFAKEGYVLHDGFEYSRQDKIHIIVDHQKKLGLPYPIRVCSFNDINCCHCEKCFRTFLGLVAENANPSDFGFYLAKSMKRHWQDVMKEHIALMGFSSEKKIYWSEISKVMKTNYSKMDKEKQEFVDWFLSYDFDREKKKAVMKYYRKNFLSIIKRKIRPLLKN